MLFRSEKTSPLDVGQAQNQEQLSGTEVNNIPYSSSHNLVNSSTLMPGVVQDASGATHVNGELAAVIRRFRAKRAQRRREQTEFRAWLKITAAPLW